MAGRFVKSKRSSPKAEVLYCHRRHLEQRPVGVTLDFGNQFLGMSRWLEIGIRTNGGGNFKTADNRFKIAVL